MKNIFFTICAICALSLVFVGCSGGDSIKGLVPVHGTVTLNGSPLDKAMIEFAPVDASGNPAIGKRSGTGYASSNGKFSINVNLESKGLPPGDYKIRVVKPDANMKSTTGKYDSFDTSGLTAKVGEKGNLDVKLELKL
jgi:hypothetical protein